MSTLLSKNCLGYDTFESCSDLSINHKRSEILGTNLSSTELNSIADSFGCKISSWPNTYLGLPFHVKSKSLMFCQPVIEKVEKKLHCWSCSHISKGCRITPIQANVM